MSYEMRTQSFMAMEADGNDDQWKRIFMYFNIDISESIMDETNTFRNESLGYNIDCKGKMHGERRFDCSRRPGGGLLTPMDLIKKSSSSPPNKFYAESNDLKYRNQKYNNLSVDSRCKISKTNETNSKNYRDIYGKNITTDFDYARNPNYRQDFIRHIEPHDLEHYPENSRHERRNNFRPYKRKYIEFEESIPTASHNDYSVPNYTKYNSSEKQHQTYHCGGEEPYIDVHMENVLPVEAESPFRRRRRMPNFRHRRSFYETDPNFTTDELDFPRENPARSRTAARYGFINIEDTEMNFPLSYNEINGSRFERSKHRQVSGCMASDYVSRDTPHYDQYNINHVPQPSCPRFEEENLYYRNNRARQRPITTKSIEFVQYDQYNINQVPQSPTPVPEEEQFYYTTNRASQRPSITKSIEFVQYDQYNIHHVNQPTCPIPIEKNVGFSENQACQRSFPMLERENFCYPNNGDSLRPNNIKSVEFVTNLDEDCEVPHKIRKSPILISNDFVKRDSCLKRPCGGYSVCEIPRKQKYYKHELNNEDDLDPKRCTSRSELSCWSPKSNSSFNLQNKTAGSVSSPYLGLQSDANNSLPEPIAASISNRESHSSTLNVSPPSRREFSDVCRNPCRKSIKDKLSGFLKKSTMCLKRSILSSSNSRLVKYRKPKPTFNPLPTQYYDWKYWDSVTKHKIKPKSNNKCLYKIRKSASCVVIRNKRSPSRPKRNILAYTPSPQEDKQLYNYTSNRKYKSAGMTYPTVYREKGADTPCVKKDESLDHYPKFDKPSPSYPSKVNSSECQWREISKHISKSCSSADNRIRSGVSELSSSVTSSEDPSCTNCENNINLCLTIRTTDCNLNGPPKIITSSNHSVIPEYALENTSHSDISSECGFSCTIENNNQRRLSEYTLRNEPSNCCRVHPTSNCPRFSCASSDHENINLGISSNQQYQENDNMNMCCCCSKLIQQGEYRKALVEELKTELLRQLESEERCNEALRKRCPGPTHVMFLPCVHDSIVNINNSCNCSAFCNGGNRFKAVPATCWPPSANPVNIPSQCWPPISNHVNIPSKQSNQVNKASECWPPISNHVNIPSECSNQVNTASKCWPTSSHPVNIPSECSNQVNTASECWPPISNHVNKPSEYSNQVNTASECSSTSSHPVDIPSECSNQVNTASECWPTCSHPVNIPSECWPPFSNPVNMPSGNIIHSINLKF